MQDNPDEKLIQAPTEPMLPKPELEIPADSTLLENSSSNPSDKEPSKFNTHSNTGIMIIVALLLINLILGVYVWMLYAARLQ